MNCQKASQQLIEDVFGELDPSNRAAFDAHLVDCESCRRRSNELRSARRLLSKLPAPTVQLSAARIQLQAAQQQQRSARRWRRAAMVAATAACAIAVAAVAQLRIECHVDHLTVAWGVSAAKVAAADAAEPSADAPVKVETKSVAPKPTAPAIAPREWRDLIETVRLLANEQSTNDRRNAAAIVALQDQLEQFRRRDAEQIRMLARDLQSLYLAQYQPVPKSKGATQ